MRGEGRGEGGEERGGGRGEGRERIALRLVGSDEMINLKRSIRVINGVLQNLMMSKEIRMNL